MFISVRRLPPNSVHAKVQCSHLTPKWLIDCHLIVKLRSKSIKLLDCFLAPTGALRMNLSVRLSVCLFVQLKFVLSSPSSSL